MNTTLPIGQPNKTAGQQVKCPNCGQYKAMSEASTSGIGAWVSFTLGLILLVIFPPVGILLLIGGLIFLMSPKSKTKMECNNCKFKWDESKTKTV